MIPTCKIYLNRRDIINVSCPECGLTQPFDVKRMQGRHRVTLRCVCHKVFCLEVDIRRYHRKKVNLDGAHTLDTESIVTLHILPWMTKISPPSNTGSSSAILKKVAWEANSSPRPLTTRPSAAT